MLKISSFPFNLVVNRQRVIEAIYANTLLPDDYERFFDQAQTVTPAKAGAQSIRTGQKKTCLDQKV